MVELWSKPIKEVSNSEFLSIYEPDIVWWDHAFLVHRKSHEGVEMLRERWLTANQPFVVTVERIHSMGTVVVLQVIAEGVFAEDLYHLKATGKSFTYQLCIVVDFNAETGLIKQISEYYTRLWDTSVPRSGYRVDETREGAPGLPSA